MVGLDGVDFMISVVATLLTILMKNPSDQKISNQRAKKTPGRSV
jgi:hypothetical protein